LTATKGPSARADAEWMACARSSLPVPVSPSSSTVVLSAAARRARLFTATTGALLPTKLEKV